MKFKFVLFISFLLSYSTFLAQQNSIKIKAVLNHVTNKIAINQKIVFYNTSDTVFNQIYLHNWTNSYSNNNTPLAKRFLKDYKKEFYFSKEKDKGSSIIHNLLVNNQVTVYNEVVNHPDILKIALKKPLNPKDSITIYTNYTVKIPNAKFTGYGKTKTGYHLRFWYLVPVVYQNKWQIMSNLNLDDLYMNLAKYNIEIITSKKYFLESNLYKYTTKNKNTNNFYLIGNSTKDVIISLDTIKKYKSLKTKTVELKTDLFEKKLSFKKASLIAKRELSFIEKYLGKYPNKQIFIDWGSVGKDRLHDIYGLPEWLKPFPENFKWEIRFLKALTIKYLNDVLLLNKRKDYWLADGIETFLMIEYVKKYYPNITVLGKFSNYWFLKKYNIAKLKQNDKYSFVYQFSARKFYDQALTTQADSLSNFNKRVVSKYKAGLGLKYLQDFVGDSILKSALKEFYLKNRLKITNPISFQKILISKTNKDLEWFFGDYIKSNKKIDYTIKEVTSLDDSLKVTIKNKRNFTAPVALYGIKNREIKFKKWITNIDSTKTVTIAKNDFDKLALNYENLYPEYNSLDNFRKTNNSLLSKPLQFRLLKDIEDPYYSQIFYTPDVKYNLYDGLILGVNFNNKPILTHNFNFSFTPNYSTKSNNFTGGFSVNYNHYFLKSKIYKIQYGISGSNYHYAPELGYNRFSPFINIQFRRNSLRAVGSKYLLNRLIYINKDVANSAQVSESDKYKVLNFRYVHNNPGAINNLQYAINTEFANNFVKFSTDIRFRKDFSSNHRFEVRLFGGYFLKNNTIGNYFNFGLNRGSDYLFDQSLFGRSENSGLFSQQFIVTDGGFKSTFSNDVFANQFISSFNTSISVWRWIEIYNDFAILKNQNQNYRFYYENGVRLNFIPNIFEFYFPVYTNEGFQFDNNYSEKIRFVITTNLDRIYNYIRLGLL